MLSAAPKVPDFCPQVEQKPQADCLARQGLGVHQANPAQYCKEICKCQGCEKTGTHACSEKVNSGITDQGHVSNNYCINSSSKNSCIHCKDRPILGEYFINYPKLCHTLVLLADIQFFISVQSVQCTYFWFSVQCTYFFFSYYPGIVWPHKCRHLKHNMQTKKRGEATPEMSRLATV